jgi:lysophospholipase L1-like esterase
MITKRAGRWTIAAVSFGLVAGVLSVGEAAARIKLSLAQKNPNYLWAPWYVDMRKFAPAEPPAASKRIEYKIDVDYVQVAEESLDPTLDKRNQETEQFYYKVKPGRHPSLPQYPYGAYHINSLGFRGSEFSPKKSTGTTRIFCLGESSTFGVESPDDRTWPARLAAHLNERGGGPFEVINAGFPGYTSVRALNLVRHELLSYDPDLVLLYTGHNELNHTAIRHSTPQAAGEDHAMAIPLWQRIHASLYYRWSMLYTLLFEKTSLWLHRTATPLHLQAVLSQDTEKRVAFFADMMEQLAQTAHGGGVKLVVVRQMLWTYPELLAQQELSIDRIKTLMQSVQGRVEQGLADPYFEFYPHYLYMEALAEVAAAHQLQMVDPRAAFAEALSRGERLFYDRVHLTPLGNDVLARVIAQHLVEE